MVGDWELLRGFATAFRTDAELMASPALWRDGGQTSRTFCRCHRCAVLQWRWAALLRTCTAGNPGGSHTDLTLRVAPHSEGPANLAKNPGRPLV